MKASRRFVGTYLLRLHGRRIIRARYQRENRWQASGSACHVLSHWYLAFFEGRDSAVGIATGYGLDYRGVGVRSRKGQEFSLPHINQTGSEVHPASYPKGAGGGALSSWVKRQEA
jgi:hypothetical protein